MLSSGRKTDGQRQNTDAPASNNLGHKNVHVFSTKRAMSIH